MCSRETRKRKLEMLSDLNQLFDCRSVWTAWGSKAKTHYSTPSPWTPFHFWPLSQRNSQWDTKINKVSTAPIRLPSIITSIMPQRFFNNVRKEKKNRRHQFDDLKIHQKLIIDLNPPRISGSVFVGTSRYFLFPDRIWNFLRQR